MSDTYEQKVFTIGHLLAAADLSAKQYHCVKVDGSGEIALSGAGENAIGILSNKPAAGQVARVEAGGIALAIYGGTITAGGKLMSDASAQVVAHSGDNAVVATALRSGVAGDILPVLLELSSGKGVTAGHSVLSIPFKFANLADGDIVTEFVPGFAGSILKASVVVTDPVTTADDAATLNLEIGTTNVTGGAVALDSAAGSSNVDTLGDVVEGTPITGNNTFTDSDTISVEASSVTAFAEGEGVLLIVLQSGGA